MLSPGVKTREKIGKLWDEYAESYYFGSWDVQPTPLKLLITNIVVEFTEEEKDVVTGS